MSKGCNSTKYRKRKARQRLNHVENVAQKRQIDLEWEARKIAAEARSEIEAREREREMREKRGPALQLIRCIKQLAAFPVCALCGRPITGTDDRKKNHMTPQHNGRPIDVHRNC